MSEFILKRLLKTSNNLSEHIKQEIRTNIKKVREFTIINTISKVLLEKDL